MKLGLLFGLGWAVATQAAVSLNSPWVVPLRETPRFDLLPYERTTPIVFGDLIFVADLQGRVRAMHRKEGGRTLWEKRLPGSICGALAYGRSMVVVGDRQGNLRALNTRDGSEAWSFKITSEWLSPPVFVRTRVGSEMRNLVIATASSGDMYALSESKGEEVWHYARRGDEKMTVFGSGGPAVFGDAEVYQGFSDGSIVALSSDRGHVIWEKNLRTRGRFYDIDMKPYVDDKRVLIANFDGTLYSLDRLRGDTQWVFPVGSYSGFLVQDNRIYFGGTNRQFYALDLTTGQTIWTNAYEAGVASTPTMIDGLLVFPTTADPVYFLNAQTGSVEKKISLGAGTLSSAAVQNEDKSLYLLSNYGNLYSYELRHQPGTVIAKPNDPPTS
ncbi:PQQ-binding-like beta-propeller repeat protein [bacterium]|nr:PQQ-binding-like beta-propeller repeat protein [bacterium]